MSDMSINGSTERKRGAYTERSLYFEVTNDVLGVLDRAVSNMYRPAQALVSAEQRPESTVLSEMAARVGVVPLADIQVSPPVPVAREGVTAASVTTIEDDDMQARARRAVDEAFAKGQTGLV